MRLKSLQSYAPSSLSRHPVLKEIFSYSRYPNTKPTPLAHCLLGLKAFSLSPLIPFSPYLTDTMGPLLLYFKGNLLNNVFTAIPPDLNRD